MARVIKSGNVGRTAAEDKSAVQRVCTGIGILFVLAGCSGVLFPGFLGMHLSLVHNSVHILSGVFAIWLGSSSPSRAFFACLGLGAFYSLLGVFGFLMGSPGYPTFGKMQADQNLFKVIPEVLEFGTMDHVVHLVVGCFLLYTTYTFRHQDHK